MNKILLLLISPLLMILTACEMKPKPEAEAAIATPKEYKKIAHNYPDMNYVFRATVKQSRVVNKGRGAATGKFPVEQLIAAVTEISKGGDLVAGQEIFIEMESKQAKCDVGDTCNFIAPYKHPAFHKGVLILKATVLP